MESKAAAGAGDEETLIDTFCGITSASREEAAFFLESHNWTIDSALHSFYNNQDEIQDDDAGHFGLPSGPDLGQEAPGRSPPLPVPSPFPSASVPVASAGKKPSSSSKPSGSGRQSGIRTLADLNRQPDPGSDSDSDGPQEYYTGGEKSGMLVQDPSKGTNDPDAIFDQARQMAAMQGTFEPNPSSSSRSFTGTGRLLSGETVPSTAPPENVSRNIYFWSNGFSVDDGPLRRFEDPENASFLESIRKSECPRELAPADRRSAVHVNLIRREENYPEPIKRHSPFQGVGRTLGSGSSSIASLVPETAAATVPPSAATAAVSSPSVGGPLVDDSLPSTSIQLRLADGTRMVARFNTSHTIGDIRAYINHRASSTATTSYTLQTVGFPPKQLSDETQTIEQAGLTNSVVIQKR